MKKKKIIGIVILLIILCSTMTTRVFAHCTPSKEIELWKATWYSFMDYELNQNILETMKNEFGYNGNVAKKEMKIKTKMEITKVNKPIFGLVDKVLIWETTYKVKIGNKEYSGFSEDDLKNSFDINSDNEDDYKEGYKWDVEIITSFVYEPESGYDTDISRKTSTAKVIAQSICSENNCSTCNNISERRRN